MCTLHMSSVITFTDLNHDIKAFVRTRIPIFVVCNHKFHTVAYWRKGSYYVMLFDPKCVASYRWQLFTCYTPPYGQV